MGKILEKWDEHCRRVKEERVIEAVHLVVEEGWPYTRAARYVGMDHTRLKKILDEKVKAKEVSRL